MNINSEQFNECSCSYIVIYGRRKLRRVVYILFLTAHFVLGRYWRRNMQDSISLLLRVAIIIAFQM